VEKITLKCPSVLVKMSVCPVKMLFLAANQLPTGRHARLSLGSDCSLNIKSVTKEDTGDYSCQQFVKGIKQGSDARVFLRGQCFCEL